MPTSTCGRRAELVELINDEDAQVAPAVRDAAPELAAAIEGIVDRLEQGGRLVYVGAGTPAGSPADAAECGPTFGLAEGRVLALALTEEAEEDDGPAGRRIAAAVGPADAVVALSASGRTPYVLGARGSAARRVRHGGRRLRGRSRCSPPSPSMRSSPSSGRR